MRSDYRLSAYRGRVARADYRLTRLLAYFYLDRVNYIITVILPCLALGGCLSPLALRYHRTPSAIPQNPSLLSGIFSRPDRLGIFC